ncbi:Acg family FMN-binding oxidoreductase [Hymenobacter rubripertinctus]|uniref:Nitroreductase n=1 Tax=Hymenobacter rubripertinctus TaxID=2029981 RepID=A0A418QMK5_9BACT|nr:nitroreductase family protein [Hymenobacter rubripertinctus]RIY06359.1 nitroreductase [Hymenobacter rubripertinctus]
MKRRHFLPLAATATLGTAAVGYYAWDQALLHDARRRGDQVRQPLPAGQLPAEARQILHLAALAPSGHNTQPWTVRLLGPYHWVIGNDPRGWLPVVDPTQRETMLSLGAFAQNLEYAAAHFAYQCRWTLLATSRQAAEVLEVELTRGPGPAYPDLTALLGRRTLRTGFANVVIQPADIERLTDADGTHCHFFAPDSANGRYLTATTLAANRQQTAHDPAQQELAHWTRWGRADVQQYRDGLTAAGMSINGVAGWAVRHFYDSASVLKPDFRQRGLDRAADQMATHGGWLVITSPDESVAALLAAGRCLERCWLRARDLNVAVHPMSQLLEETPGTLGAARRLGLPGPVQFVLRLGYVTHYPVPVSLRRPVEWFVQT